MSDKSELLKKSREKYIKDVCKSTWQIHPQIPIFRTLPYLKSSVVFEKLHNPVKEMDISIRVNEAAKEYGKSLRDHIEFVEQWFHDPLFKTERQKYLEISEVWSLCELLYFSESNNDASKKLMDWFNEYHQPLFYEYDRQAIYNHPEGSFHHPEFWPYAIRMASLGQLSHLSSLLKHALLDVSLSQYSDVLTFMLEIRNIINEEQIDTSKLNKAILTLRQMNFSNNGTKEHANQLYQVMAILAGDEDCSLQHASSGIHAFICNFYYTPSNNTSVHTRAKIFFSKYPQLSSDVMQSLLVENLQLAIEQSIKFDWWFLAHLTDLFHIKNMIDRPILVNMGDQVLSFNIRDHFILYYASFIKNSLGLWKEAFGYMLSCGELGRDLIVEHLRSQDMKQADDTKLQEMVDYCNHHSLENIGAELYRSKASYCITIKDYEGAIKYYKLEDQQKDIDPIFYEMIQSFIMTGQLFDMDSLGPVDCTGPYYTICLGLHRMNTFYMNGLMDSAAKAFKNLINDERIPKTMIPIIIWEGLKLIEGEDNSSFTAKDIKGVKKIWQKFNQSISFQDFKLFHFYMQKDKSNLEEPSAEMVINDKEEFLSVTGVSFSRALLRATTKQTRSYTGA